MPHACETPSGTGHMRAERAAAGTMGHAGAAPAPAHGTASRRQRWHLCVARWRTAWPSTKPRPWRSGCQSNVTAGRPRGRAPCRSAERILGATLVVAGRPRVDRAAAFCRVGSRSGTAPGGLARGAGPANSKGSGVGKTRRAVDCAASRCPFALLGAQPGDRDGPRASAWMSRAPRILADTSPDKNGLPPWALAELARLMPEIGAAPPMPLCELRVMMCLAFVDAQAAPGAWRDAWMSARAAVEIALAVNEQRSPAGVAMSCLDLFGLVDDRASDRRLPAALDTEATRPMPQATTGLWVALSQPDPSPRNTGPGLRCPPGCAVPGELRAERSAHRAMPARRRPSSALRRWRRRAHPRTG
jgi:hypothetical protein